jgi:small-conductance mechanosensitive channel
MLTQTVPSTDHIVEFLLYDWGIVVPAIVVVILVSKFGLVRPVVGYLYPETRPGTRRVIARLTEVALWLSVPLVLSTRVDLEAVFGAGIGAIFVAYLVREPLKNSLSNFVAAATIASNEHLHPGVRVRLPTHDVEGVVEAIDTDEVHVRLDDGDLTHVPNDDFVGSRWTTVHEE